jgi:uncharacterized protein YndB with AHSA1/START domain
VYEIYVSQFYNAEKTKVFELIKSGVLFELTGANEISFDFWEGGTFQLIFSDRGEISGTINEIVNDERIVLNWNVNGFGREPERNTTVVISLHDATTLNIHHSKIMNHEAKEAKIRAWSEILNEIKEKISS